MPLLNVRIALRTRKTVKTEKKRVLSSSLNSSRLMKSERRYTYMYITSEIFKVTYVKTPRTTKKKKM